MIISVLRHLIYSWAKLIFQRWWTSFRFLDPQFSLFFATFWLSNHLSYLQEQNSAFFIIDFERILIFKGSRVANILFSFQMIKCKWALCLLIFDTSFIFWLVWNRFYFRSSKELTITHRIGTRATEITGLSLFVLNYAIFQDTASSFDTTLFFFANLRCFKSLMAGTLTNVYIHVSFTRTLTLWQSPKFSQN